MTIHDWQAHTGGLSTDGVYEHHTLWSSGELRCVLVTEPLTQTCFVQVFHDDRAIYTEPCRDADGAALVGERLWNVFVENAT